MNNKEEIRYPEGVLVRKAPRLEAGSTFPGKRTTGKTGELFSKVVRMHVTLHPWPQPM